MKKTPLVSIIIPVYNIEKYIEECLESVRRQSYTHFECLVIDDCGNDQSIPRVVKFIQRFEDDRFKILHRFTNGGLSAARNTGIDNACGDYLYFVDGDDKIFPDALKNLVSVVDKYPDVEIVQGNVMYQEGEAVWHFSEGTFPEYSENREWIRTQMLRMNIAVSAWNKLYRLDYIRKNKLQFLEGIINEDVKWCWDNQKLLSSIAFCSDICYWYRTDNQASIMHETDKTRSSISFLIICNQIKNEINDDLEIKFIKDCLLHIRVTLNRWAYSKNRKLIRSYLKDMLRDITSSSMRSRCLSLYILSYIFPFNLYIRIWR